MKISFSKYQATGNDFVLIDGISNNISLTKDKITHICSRHFGVGADGLIIAKPSDCGDIFMDYYNADGTIAEMCGNGIRCLAAFALNEIQGIDLLQRKVKPKTAEIKIETRAGIKIVTKENGLFVVNMGKPSFSNNDIGFNSDKEMWDYPVIVPVGHSERSRRISGFSGKQTFKVYGVSMGNPHCIIYTSKIDNKEVKNLGAKIEKHPLFKNRINVEWVEQVSENELKVEVFERGVGYTLACGTGACAVFAVSNRLGLVKNKAIISLPGGKLQVELRTENLFLKGEAKKVFEGVIEANSK